ncbi:hypothetical protein Mapa_006266 [Marchantia paleacea]|nr:hypothetical protein Mapa_006266 [Marchantia paleacea]
MGSLPPFPSSAASFEISCAYLHLLSSALLLPLNKLRPNSTTLPSNKLTLSPNNNSPSAIPTGKVQPCRPSIFLVPDKKKKLLLSPLMSHRSPFLVVLSTFNSLLLTKILLLRLDSFLRLLLITDLLKTWRAQDPIEFSLPLFLFSASPRGSLCTRRRFHPLPLQPPPPPLSVFSPAALLCGSVAPPFLASTYVRRSGLTTLLCPAFSLIILSHSHPLLSALYSLRSRSGYSSYSSP